MDPTHVVNWQRIDDRITTSGQPSEVELAEIAALGVRHVVNLGLHSHPRALPDEAATLAHLGVTYIHQPVDFQNPTLEDFRRFCAVMTEIGSMPVHVHCIMNFRVSAFLFRYHRDILGMDEADARARMDQIWKPDGVWGEFIADRRV